jgi:hypothetical protein
MCAIKVAKCNERTIFTSKTEPATFQVCLVGLSLGILGFSLFRTKYLITVSKLIAKKQRKQKIVQVFGQ